VKSDIRKTVPDADGNYISIVGQDSLQAPRNLDGLAVHIILVPFQLARRMYGLPLPSICILVQDCNNRSMLGCHDSPSCHNGDIGDLVVVNVMDIHCSIRFLYDTNIVTCNATISASVDKQARFVRLVGGDRIKDAMGMDLAILFASH